MKAAAAQTVPARVSKRGRLEGRPSKATPEIWQTLCDLMVLGIPDEDACVFAGVTPSKFYEWKKKPEFREETARVRVSRALGWLKRIESEPVGWQRFKWLLQSRFPAWFGSPDGETNVTLNQQINSTLIADAGQLERVRRILDEAGERNRIHAHTSNNQQLAAQATLGDELARIRPETEQVTPSPPSHVRQRDKKVLPSVARKGVK